MKNKLFIFSLLIFAILMAGCSTQSDKWLNVHYHNLTTHYNVWWNGNESLKEGVKKLEQTHVDDYTQLLPVYKLGTKQQAMTVNPQMDKAIEKGIKGIKKHSIYLKGREHVAYVKNCYLLTAYGSFYKQDYQAAINTCRLIIVQYSGSSEADEARILLARCQTQDKQYSEAESLLDVMVNEVNANNFSRKLTDKLYCAMVDCLLPQEKYKKAVQYLRLAIDETTDKRLKGRLYYIMAQIYQTLDKRPTATKYFEKVLSCKPDYVLEFNARMNMASCSDVNHTNVAEQVKVLDKMLKDKKNVEFKDQIYCAKGDLFLGVKDAQKACDNYKLSVASATNNPAQKAKSAIKMAEVLYEVFENYDLSQIYYDTAMQIIKSGYPRFDEIRSRYNVLTSLVEYTRQIHLNDSLIALADMSPQDRNAMINKKIADLKKKEAEEKERKLLEELANDAKAQQNTLQGDWYFYNNTNLSKGKETFRQHWGVRTLEDYWFLSKKGAMGMGSMLSFGGEDDSFDEDADSTSTDSTTVATSLPGGDPNDPHSPAFYTKDMPTTQGRRDTMNLQIAHALLNAGFIFYDGLNNTEKALECYLRMAQDYSDNPEIVQAFYQLYRIYDKQGNTPSANYYRDMVLMGFPDCDYANMLRDENYYKEIIRRSQLVKEDYEKIYNNYRRRRYPQVIALAEQAETNYASEPLLAKYQYWKGLAYAQMNETQNAITTLQKIVDTYPSRDSIVPLAQAQLDFLKKGGSSSQNTGEDITMADEETVRKNDVTKPQERDLTLNQDEEELPPESKVFRFKEKQPHYVLVLVNDKKIVATELQYKVADFNMLNYSNNGLRVSPMMFTDTTQLLTIYQFQTATEAMNYYTHIQLPGGPLEKYDIKDYIVMVMSTQNFATFYNRKDQEAYDKFFRRYYSEIK